LKVYLENYSEDFKSENQRKESNGNLSHSVVRQRRYATDELVSFFQYNSYCLDTDDFYGSVDRLMEFFDQTAIHKMKVACIRNFLEYIQKDLPTKQGDRIYDMKDRLKFSRIGDSSSDGMSRADEIRKKILSKEQIEFVRNVASKKEKLIFDCMFELGTRPGELTAGTPRDFNWRNGSGGVGATFKVNKTFSQGIGIQDFPKTENSNRTVNLKNSTAERLKVYIEDKGIGNNQLVFGKYRDIYDNIKDLFSYSMIKMGDNGATTFSPHSIRHNTVTKLIREGYPKEEVQRYMGHSSVAVTEIYEHFDEDEIMEIYQ
jgi:integrase